MEKEEIHIGKKIKDVMIDRRMRASEFAGKIGQSSGGISRLFNRKEFHCSQLRKICEVLDYDFFRYYLRLGEGDEKLGARIGELERENVSLRKENAYLKEINELLKGKV